MKLNKKMIETFDELLQNGNPPKVVCDFVGIEEKTYYNWFQKGKELYFKIEEGEISKTKLSQKDKNYFDFFITSKKSLAMYKISLLQGANTAMFDRYDKEGKLISKINPKTCLDLLARREPRNFAKTQDREIETNKEENNNNIIQVPVASNNVFEMAKEQQKNLKEKVENFDKK